MVYLKSVVVGIVTTFMVAIGSAIVVILVLLIKWRNLPEGTAIGWDPVSLLRNSLIPWLVLIAAFVLGFWWEYHRAVR